MVIIETDYNCFDDYLNSLSKTAKKNYVYVKKHNQDLMFEMVPFDKSEVEQFMQLWEQQLVHGKPVKWCFPIEFVEQLNKANQLLCFRARKGNETLALHFIQKRTGFWECHPPMYEKNEENEKRYLAKYMWFSLIQYFIGLKLGVLDMGGGVDSWPKTIRRRDEFPNLNYKWMYVPEKAKRQPENEKPYILKSYGSDKILDVDGLVLLKQRQFKFLVKALLRRYQFKKQALSLRNMQLLVEYTGEKLAWSDPRIQDNFMTAGIHADGWLEKQVAIKFLNNANKSIRIMGEFPGWSGKPSTVVVGKINGKRIKKTILAPGAVELKLGPLHENALNTIQLSFKQAFNLPAPDGRRCYLQLISLG